MGWIVRAGFYAAIAGLLAFAGLVTFGMSLPPAAPYWDRFEVAGVLRNSPAGWIVQSDPRHRPVGISVVRVSEDGLYVIAEFAKTFEVVHSGYVVADEYFTTEVPVRAGLSLGLDRAQIYFATVTGEPVRPDDLSARGNFFFSASGSVLVTPPKRGPIARLAAGLAHFVSRGWSKIVR